MVSIIITYIDEVQFLSEALDAALSQTYSTKEVIAVCNDIVDRSLGADYPSVQWVHEPRRGSAFARNKGLQNASGEWIQFLDVDDLILPPKISEQLLVMATGAVVSPHVYQQVNGKKILSKWLPGDIWVGLLNSGLGSTSSMLWNKQAVMAVGGWSALYQSHQEYELLFRILKSAYSVGFCDRRDTIVRERKSGSITLLTQALRAKEGIILRESMYAFLQENALNTSERENAFLQYLFRQLRGIYIREPAKANMLYKKYFPAKKFYPEKNGILFYAILFKTFGFSITENIMGFYRKLRDTYLPVLPKNKS